MKYKLIQPKQEPSRHDGVVLCLLADAAPKRGSRTYRMLSDLGLDLGKLEKSEGFASRASQDLSLSVVQDGQTTRVVLVGLGAAGDVDGLRLRRRMQRVGSMLRARKFKRPLVVLPAGLSMDARDVLETAVVALTLGAGKRITHASKTKDDGEPSMVQVTLDVRSKKVAPAAVRRASALGEIIVEARSWVSEPANWLGPADLARRAVALGRAHGVRCETWTPARIRKERMGMLEEVGKGSSRTPRMVKMSYRPRGKSSAPHVVVVGKGIVFDTGGLSLKPVKGMPSMKNDMAGAATAAGVAAAAAALKLPVRVTALLPIAENTPSSRSYRPGDVISGRLGKSVEIITTDAEGRLVMADALAYGAEMKPDAMIDVATLTGACLVALGSSTAGLWSNTDELAEDILHAASQTGESLWRMPLLEEIMPFMRSDVADLRNTQADPYGGAIAAALFLGEFVGKTSWAHMDIAGPAFNDKRTEAGPRGATGYGITTLVRYLANLSDR